MNQKNELCICEIVFFFRNHNFAIIAIAISQLPQSQSQLSNFRNPFYNPAPRFKTEKPIISPDGKKAKLEWFPVEGANSYKVCSNNAKRDSILDGKT